MFSALIPVYNHEKYLVEAIYSCLSDDLVSEVLIVDDGSKDGSPDVIESFSHHPKVRILDNGGTNIGAHNRLNQLAKAARSEWLAVLNSDDAFAPHRFQTARQIIREKQPRLIMGGIAIINESSQIIGTKCGPADPEYPFPKLLAEGDQPPSLAHLANQNFVATTSNMIFAKSLFEELGGFRDYRYIHDWDFALRASFVSGWTFTPAFLTKYRVHSANTIKENPLFIDGEVTHMFCTLFSEFRENFVGDSIAIGIAGNHHLDLSSRDYITASMDKTSKDPSAFSRIFMPSRAFPMREQRSLLAQQIWRAGYPSREPCIVRAGNIPRGDKDNTKTTIFLPGRPVDSFPAQILAQLEDDDTRKTIVILSGFFAVGGVERNTVEIIRHLSSHFRFVVVTFEPHYEDVGSLHHQLDELGALCVDLGHLIPADKYEDALAQLNKLVSPQAVWIINGASWLAENAGRVRAIFGSSKIIDQQVYDTKAGWIQEFHRPGILAADHFIAVNKKIEDVFRLRFNIPPNRIKQIYPALSLEKVSSVDFKRSSRATYERKYGLADGKINIGFIGRLTEQKRPERFIEIAKRNANDERYQFILVGTGPREEMCAQAIAEYSLDNIRMINFFEDVSDIGAFLDGLVICSDFEGLPIALLESMSMGIPFLSTDVGDIRKIRDIYGGGVILDHWTDDDAEREIRDWLNVLHELRDQINQSVPRLRDDFSAKRLALDYRQLFCE